MIKKVHVFRVILAACFLCFLGCKKEQATTLSPRHVSVHVSPLTKRLYFSGVIKPLSVAIVSAPADGLINDVQVDVGDHVVINQPLFAIHSDSFQQEFSTALAAFLKAKDQLSQSKSNFDSGAALFDEGLISRNEMDSIRSSYYSNNLSYLEAEESLNKLIETRKAKMDVSSLDIKNIDKLNEILDTHIHAQSIPVFSPSSGIVLLPEDEPESMKSLANGLSIKRNDTVLLVGDMQGLAIEVGVSELDINQIKPGLPAIITSVGFPGISLKGIVTHVGTQATVARGGPPEFVCVVSVNDLTPQQQAIIHVGMSAKVEILIVQPENIVIPISAVFQQNNVSMVKVLRNAKEINVEVTTGETNIDSVVILNGLSEGDEIVIPR